MATGDAVLAAQAMGADLAGVGPAFIATEEANAEQAYKQAIVDNASGDIVYSSLFTGVHGNYLRPSIETAGMDPDNLPDGDISSMGFGSGGDWSYGDSLLNYGDRRLSYGDSLLNYGDRRLSP